MTMYTKLIPAEGVEPTLEARGYSLPFNQALGRSIIWFSTRLEALPTPLVDVLMHAIQLELPNARVTAAEDGRYVDGDITARVYSFIKDGIPQQSIKVVGTGGTTLEELNVWFDALVLGRKRDKNVSRAEPSAPAASSSDGDDILLGDDRY